MCLRQDCSQGELPESLHEECPLKQVTGPYEVQLGSCYANRGVNGLDVTPACLVYKCQMRQKMSPHSCQCGAHIKEAHVFQHRASLQMLLFRELMKARERDTEES